MVVTYVFRTREKGWVGAACMFLALMVAGLSSGHAEARADADQLSRFAGYYAAGDFQVAYVDYFDGRLSIQPPGWSSRPTLGRQSETSFFQSLPSRDPTRLVRFADFLGGAPQELVMEGFGKTNERLHFRRVTPGHEPPGLLVLRDQPVAAAAKALQAPDVAMSDVAAFALGTVQSRPSKAPSIFTFVDRYLRLSGSKPTPEILFARALTEVMLGQRIVALSDFKAVLERQPDNEEAHEYVELLSAQEPGVGEGYRALLPFKLDDLYAPPTPAEIASVLHDWETRDLRPGTVEVVHRSRLDCGGNSYRVRILKHNNRGVPHYGALLIPERGRARLASIIDVRGVDPGFSPMDLNKCAVLLLTLGEEARNLAVLIPAMNGHEIQLDGLSFKSGGDPSDSWDGGTDAVITFLNAALAVEPRLKPKKIAIHGHSRGGGVAMLAAIRDKRISLVLSRAGPVDWFEAMQPVDGISWADSLRVALSNKQAPAPMSRASQHYDTFIDRVVDSGETLAQARHRMIASSAYYFADRLPETHAFYGRDDAAVGPLNAEMLALRLSLAGQLQPGSSVEVYEGVGHDTDWYRSAVVISHALKRWLGR